MAVDQPLSAIRKRWTMIAVILGSGIVFLDTTVVNVALPKIGEELPSGLFGVLEGQSYVYNGYLLTLSALLILAGALNDYFGRQRMFALGLIGFGATSVLCGLSWNMESLVAFRILQGAAGALLVPGSLAIITATFSGEEQGRAFGLWAGASAATTILGPFVGGLLVDNISWRAAFFLNVPLVAVAFYATIRYVADSRDEESTGRFDWVGAAVVALAVGGLSFGAIRGQQTDWEDTAAFVALGVGAVAAIIFPFLMARSSHPLVPLQLFKSRNFTVTNLSTLLIYGALYVAFYFSGIFIQGTLGYTAAAAGLMGVPGTLFLALFSSRFGTLAARYGPRVFMGVGPSVMALGLLWFVRIPAGSEAWTLELRKPSSLLPPTDYLVDVLPALVVFGIGLMIMVAPLTTALMTSVPSRNSGVASAINNAISRVGPQLGGAVVFIAITASFYAGLGDRLPGLDVSSSQVRDRIAPLNRPDPTLPSSQIAAARGASTDAFHLAMVVSAAALLTGAAVNAVGIRNPRKEPEAPPEIPAAEPVLVAPRAAERRERPPHCQHTPVPVIERDYEPTATESP
jgi:EmrB/QacA subfamily drug resistance transporter